MLSLTLPPCHPGDRTLRGAATQPGSGMNRPSRNQKDLVVALDRAADRLREGFAGTGVVLLLPVEPGSPEGTPEAAKG
jgi:hypothetical protein